VTVEIDLPGDPAAAITAARATVDAAAMATAGATATAAATVTVTTSHATLGPDLIAI
jgi:hypothetical protein